MSEKKLEIEIPLLLPGVEDQDDACLGRLESALQGHKGLRYAHIKKDRQPVTLCLHYDPNITSIEHIRRVAEQAGARIMTRYRHDYFTVEGMDCSDCVLVIEHGVGRMDGVLNVSANYATQNVRVEYDARKTGRSEIEKRLRSLGYQLPTSGINSWYRKYRELIFSLIAGVLVLTGWTGHTFFGLLKEIALSLYITAYIFGGWDIARHTWHALREKHFDTDTLMIIAAIGAAILGEFAEGAFLLFLFSLGHALEDRALNRARQAVHALADLAPKTALVLRNNLETELPIEQLQLNDVVIVRPGARLPVDGIVLTGQSAVNQAPVTGESIPVDKSIGDTVFAGTVNGEGALEVKVTKLSKDSTLARVMSMVEEAQMQKSPTQQTVEKFSRVFVPAVLIVTGLVIVVPPVLGMPFHESFLRAMTLLVAASPCALALGTPASILAGIAQAARNGILVKGGMHLENLGRLKVVAFDKTGTLTHGLPEVTDVLPLDPHMRVDDILTLAGAVESRSGHPLAQAIVGLAQKKGVSLPKTEDVISLTGMGLRASVNDHSVVVGSRQLMDEEGISLSDKAQQKIETLQAEGKTVMLVARGNRLSGLIALADTLRTEAAATMQALHRLGIVQTIMLTGDNIHVAQAIARQAGISSFRGNLLPQDKLAAIGELNNQFGYTAMVGDGVNDAPALASATVGIAMGGAGTDVALETADVALMGDDLSRLPFAVGLGRATQAIIRQNLFIALGVIALLSIASLLGWAAIGVAIIFHEGSTIVVVLNALRLLGYRESKS